MAEPQKAQPLPPLPPPQTRIVDADGRMTKEFYDYLLRLNNAVAAQLAATRARIP